MLSTRDLELARLADGLGAALRARRVRLVTAESCTGGWIAKVCTDLPGSSQWFECGFVTYSNVAKMRDLGVTAETLGAHGAVSEETVAAMARGALARSEGQLAIAVSGVAGPDGGSVDKPVGTVWLAVAREVNGHIELRTELQQLDGDRDEVRRASVFRALELAVEFIQ